MGKEAPRPCGSPGCPDLIIGKQKLCDRHERERYRQYKDSPRGRLVRETNRFYDSADWKRLRRQRLDIDPLCVMCLKHGKSNIADTVDHIVPIKVGGEALDLDNTQSLCKSCHGRKSILEMMAFKRLGI